MQFYWYSHVKILYCGGSIIMKKLRALAIICLCFLSGCQKQQVQSDIQESDTGTAQESSKQSAEGKENVLMARGKIAFGTYVGYSVELVMTEGNFYTRDESTVGGGIYDENYEGQYVLQLVDAEGNVADQLSLNEDWGENEINFPGTFEICVNDYNTDRLPDFTIGNYGSSNTNIYRLYSVSEDGKIVNIADEAGFGGSTGDFSIDLEQKEGSTDFYTHFYDNTLGEEKTEEWIWSDGEKYKKTDSVEKRNDQTQEIDSGEKLRTTIEDFFRIFLNKLLKNGGKDYESKDFSTINGYIAAKNLVAVRESHEKILEKICEVNVEDIVIEDVEEAENELQVKVCVKYNYSWGTRNPEDTCNVSAIYRICLEQKANRYKVIDLDEVDNVEIRSAKDFIKNVKDKDTQIRMIDEYFERMK